jgi:hypothetical protein
VNAAEDLQAEYPLVQPLAALAERVLEALVRPGGETVERHRHAHLDLAHVI